MRAVQITEFGDLDVLKVADVDVPEPGEDEVLIRVSHAGINFADTHQRENSYLAKFELPLVPGGEVAGVVERGSGDIAEGTRVIAMLRSGGYAEYAVAPLATTFPIPDGVDDGTALALLIQGITAWHLYRTSAKLEQGESVIGFWLMHLLARPHLLRDSLTDLLDRAARGELRVVVGGTYPMSEVRRAHEELQARRTSGKLLLDPT